MKVSRIITILVIVLVFATSVAAITPAPRLKVSLLSYSPNPVQPGQTMDLYIQVENTRTATEDVSLEIIEDYPFTFEKSHDSERAKNLGPVTSKQTLLFRVSVDEEANDGVTPLRVRYKRNAEDEMYLEEQFDINVQTFDARIDVTDVEQVPTELAPGEKGKLILTLKNLDDRPLKNVDVILDLTNSYSPETNMQNMLSFQSLTNARLEEVNRRVASGLSPLKGATPMMNGMEGGSPMAPQYSVIATSGTPNQKRIQFFKSREVKTVEFDIVALPDAKVGIYSLPLYVNYNDEDNNPFFVRSDLPLTVNTDSDIYVDLRNSKLRTPDFAGDITFTVANRGLSNVRFLTVDLLENEELFSVITAPSSIYVGELASGESKDITFNVLPHTTEVQFSLDVSFTDSFNQKEQFKKDIPFTIINKNYYRDMPFEMMVSWAIVALVFLALTIFFVHQMAKKRD